jgi:hypothetical protein
VGGEPDGARNVLVSRSVIYLEIGQRGNQHDDCAQHKYEPHHTVVCASSVFTLNQFFSVLFSKFSCLSHMFIVFRDQQYLIFAGKQQR